MKSNYVATALFGLLVGCSSGEGPTPSMPSGVQSTGKELILKASDGRLVYADFFPSRKPNSGRVILMFHQAGSNASEYETIAPKIADLGFDCIAIDQRSGGDMWERINRTVNRSGAGTYMEAYSDLLGALHFAEAKKYSAILVWGSSYSASLVLKLAAEHDDIKGVLSFSPGEYMDDKAIVTTWVRKLTVPILFACTEGEWSDGRSELFDSVSSKDKVALSLPGGVHGSSTLIIGKSEAASSYMLGVREFLRRWEKLPTKIRN